SSIDGEVEGESRGARGLVCECVRMRWEQEQARERFAKSRGARLATADASGKPHLVPGTFVTLQDTAAIALDAEPKPTSRRNRSRNIAESPQVTLLADEYSDDWEHLWWVRADGHARVVHGDVEWWDARERLVGRYPQYRREPPEGVIILVTVARWS